MCAMFALIVEVQHATYCRALFKKFCVNADVQVDDLNDTRKACSIGSREAAQFFMRESFSRSWCFQKYKDYRLTLKFNTT